MEETTAGKTENLFQVDFLQIKRFLKIRSLLTIDKFSVMVIFNQIYLPKIRRRQGKKRISHNLFHLTTCSCLELGKLAGASAPKTT